MNETVRDVREAAAERELTGHSEHCIRACDEANAVQAALECALTARPSERAAARQVEPLRMIPVVPTAGDTQRVALPLLAPRVPLAGWASR